jgi:hypothetical protein
MLFGILLSTLLWLAELSVCLWILNASFRKWYNNTTTHFLRRNWRPWHPPGQYWMSTHRMMTSGGIYGSPRFAVLVYVLGSAPAQCYGMVQAWVAHHFVTPLKCRCYKFDWWVMSQKPHKKHKLPNKHHHHGGEAANPPAGARIWWIHNAWGVGVLALIFSNAAIKGFI